MLSPHALLAKQNVAELVKPLLAHNPLCRFQRAACESFAAARGVAQRDGVGGGIEADLVRARDARRRGWTRRRWGARSRPSSSPPPASAACPTARPSWCRDEFPTPTRRIPARRPAAARLPPPAAKKTFTPTEKLGLHTSADAVLLDNGAARGRGRSSQPVVPTTTGTPQRGDALRRCSTTAAGMENSMATSMPAKFSASCRRSRVVELVELERDREAVLRRELLDQPAHLSVADDARVSCSGAPSFENRRVEFAEELLVQRFDGARSGRPPPPRS